MDCFQYKCVRVKLRRRSMQRTRVQTMVYVEVGICTAHDVDEVGRDAQAFASVVTAVVNAVILTWRTKPAPIVTVPQSVVPGSVN